MIEWDGASLLMCLDLAVQCLMALTFGTEADRFHAKVCHLAVNCKVEVFSDTTYHLSPSAMYRTGAKQMSETVCIQRRCATRRQCSEEGGGVVALIGAQHVSQATSGCLASASSIAMHSVCDQDGHVATPSASFYVLSIRRLFWKVLQA